MHGAPGLLDILVDLSLGGVCAGCSAPGRSLCRGCADLLRSPPWLSWPQPVPPGLPVPFAVAPYDGPVRRLLIAAKEHQRYGLAGPLGVALASSVAAVLATADHEPAAATAVGLVPPASAAAVIRRRGHDPVLRMTREAAQALRRRGIACQVVPALRRARRVADQSGLSAEERWRNLATAYEVRGAARINVSGRRLVVVDDVLTTGATAAEVTRALGVVGGRVLGVAVVAATERHRRQPPAVAGGGGAD